MRRCLRLGVFGLCVGWGMLGFSGWVFAADVVQLSDLKPLQSCGDVAINATLLGEPLDLGELIYVTGLGVTAGSDLVYDVSRHDGRFEAWVGIDPNLSANRSGRFRAIADQQLVFDSGKIDQTNKRRGQNPTRPVRVVVPLGDVQQLRLTFGCEDQSDQASLFGGWGDAKLVPASAPEYSLAEYQQETLTPTPPMGWNSWCRYGTGINEDLIKQVGDAMVQSGMRDAGYVFNHRSAPRHWRFGDFDGPEGEIGRFQTNRPWETCAKIGGAWGWSGHGPGMSLADCVGLLVRCAGNGGNLLLNTGPAPDGTINPRHVERYLQMGAWLQQFGESIYATRGGPYKPGPWGCATRSKDKNTVYLHILASWDGVIRLPDLPAKVVASRVLTGGAATVTQADGMLTVAVDADEKRGRKFLLHEFDTVIALEFDRPAMKLPILETVSESLTVGATASASSQSGSDHPAQALVASDMTEFSDGIFVKQTWSPHGADKAPWVQLDLKEPTPISQVAIQEGKYGAASAIKGFTISLRIDGRWQTVYRGDAIGGSFAVVLSDVHEADAIRLEFERWNGRISINQINAYQSL